MPHRLLNAHPVTGEPGIYLEGEIAGLAQPLWLAKTDFPPLRGAGQAQRIANLEADLAAIFDAQMGTSAQRIRVHVFSLVPDVYAWAVFASASAIPVNWWGGP